MSELSAKAKGITYLIFSLSGFCALVYEVLWTKQLSLTFGTTMVAVSIVAATFMAGLALGSYLIGKSVDNKSNLLHTYALLELAIAVFALLFPPLLEVVSFFHIALSQLLPSFAGLGYAVDLILSALLLMPPTICMGGTFPLMCRFFARKKSGGQIGRLYAMNTLGATLGAVLCGYLLIPSLGLSSTILLAVSLNLAIAATAWFLARSTTNTTLTDTVNASRTEQLQLARKHRPILIAIGCIGFFSLAYEILWTRVFLLFLGNTSYAFSMILGSFLVGIAIGGAIYARKIHPGFDEKKLFVRLTVLMGLSILVTLPFYDDLAHVFLLVHSITGERWWPLTLLSGAIVFGVMCIPTIISGSLLPAAIAILDPGKKHTGEGVGQVVLHNTIGAVFGCLVAGFVLIPFFGIQHSFQLLAVLTILLGVTLCFHFTPKLFSRLLSPISIACMLGAALLIIPSQWDPELMNSGVYVYAPKYNKNGGIEKVLASEKIIEVIEGIDTTVAVHESNDGQFRFFTVNGKTDGGSSRDMTTQILVGHLPLLLHPDPEDVLVIGLGTGITLRGMSSHPTRQIDCVEISPGVCRASEYFSEANSQATSDPKVSLLINDGRNQLLTQPKKYDVIVSEPSNPWQSGNANLFTHEFYQLAAQRLKQGGLFAQWIGIYDITPENLRIAVNTLLKTFPKTMTFRAGADIIIVGAQQDLHFNYLDMKKRMARSGIQETLQLIGIATPGDLVANYYFCSAKTLGNFSKNARTNSDDNPILEYSARYTLGQKTEGAFQMQNMKALLASRQHISIPLSNMGRNTAQIAQSLRELGNDYAKAGRTKEAQQFVRKAQKIEKKGRIQS